MGREGWRVLPGGGSAGEPAGRVRCARCGEFIPMNSTRCVHCGAHFAGYAFQFTHPSERRTPRGTPLAARIAIVLLLLAMLAAILLPFMP